LKAILKFYRVDILDSDRNGTTQVFHDESRAKQYKADLLKEGYRDCDVWLTITF
jgi:hypothetical protein